MTILEELLAKVRAQGRNGIPAPAQSFPIMPRDPAPREPQNPAPRPPLEPYAPPNVGPLSFDTSAAYAALNPEPVPPRFVQPAPIDTASVDSRLGPAPTPPVQRDPSFIDKLGAVLLGVGYGPQGVEMVRQQREAPLRRYEAQVADYTQRRDRALEIAERRAEREADALHRANQATYEREYNQWLRRNDIRDDAAKQRMAQAFTLERDARRDRIEEEKEQRREHARRLDDARSIAARLGTGPGAAPPHIAKELGEFYANVRQTVSPAAAKWQNAQARRAEILARPAVGGGGAVSRRDAQDLQRRTSQAAAGIANMEKLARQAMESPEEKRAPILNQMRAMAATLQAQFPELLETGEHNGWPYARLRLRGSQAPQQPQSDPLGILR